MRRTKRTKRTIKKVRQPVANSWKATLVLQALMNVLPRNDKQPKLLNNWKFKNEAYFHDMGQNQTDGTIVGTIWKFDGENKAKKVAAFKIDSSGKIIRFATTTKQQREIAEKLGEAEYSKLYK